jgi:prepilin-type N-terminal cleavage/methylation domain-containing protein
MQRGFTLTELAVVFAIMTLLIGGARMTLSARIEERNYNETLRRLDAATEAVTAFAVVNKRLPCPAHFTSAAVNSQGRESFCSAATGTCAGTETLTVQAHGNCSNFYNGVLPAASVGVAPVDDIGFAVDPWGNRLRYAVAQTNTGCTTTPPANTRVFTSQANMKAYGVGCRPNDLDVCTRATCAARVVSTQTAVFIVFSTGKNGAAGPFGTDELENTDNDVTFVSRTPSGSDSSFGTFDDLVAWAPVGVVYSKLIAAGVLP